MANTETLQVSTDGAEPAPTGKGRLAIACLLLLVAVGHVPSLFAPFFIDDYIYIDTASRLDETGLADIFTTSTMTGSASSVWWTPNGVLPFYRPIAEMTLALDYYLWGLAPLGFHLTNLLLHVLCTWLAWRVGLRLFDGRKAALVVGVVFGLHPVHGEAVAWISGRFDLLVCACALASALAFIRWSNGEGRKWWNGLLCLGWFVIGLGCKETALVLPAVLLVFALIRPKDRPRIDTKRFVALGLAFGVISVIYLAGRFKMFGGLGHLPPPYGLDHSTIGTALSGLAWNTAQYLLDFVLFIQVDAIYIADFWAAHPVLFGAVLVVAVTITVICLSLAWSSRASRVGLAWITAFSAPCLLAMPGERNVYLASVGLALIAAGAWERLCRLKPDRPAFGRRLRHAGTAVVCLWLTMAVIEQGVMWCVAGPGEKLFRDLETLLPDPPKDARIYIVNLCPLNAVALDQAVKVRYGRSDISACGLTLAPTLESTSMDRITRTGSDTIRIDRENGVYFKSFIERFHLFSDPVSQLPASARRLNLELINPPDSFDGLTQLEFRLPYAIDDPRVSIFVWNNERIKSPIDLISVTRLAALERFDPQVVPAMTATE